MKKYSFALATLVFVLFSISVLVRGGTAEQKIYKGYGVAMHGKLKYGSNFKHFEYVNPNAPKKGKVRLSAIGTFDSLNPFILRGMAPAGIGGLFGTLMVGSDDEAFSMYGLIAESIEFPEDRSWVAFTIRPEARFNDGSPITPEDVMFSMKILKEKGHPFYRQYYANVVSWQKVGKRKVKFLFNVSGNRELPLIVGQLTILSKKYWSTHDFDKTTLEAPLGSGPYRVKSVDPGRSITYELVDNWWGRDLSVNKGKYNFKEEKYVYYRDDSVCLEAFKAGKFDFRYEFSSKLWATDYQCSHLAAGEIKKEEIPHELPAGMQALVFNTRCSVFRDKRIREALAYAFDFEWINKTLMYSAYTRTKSYFANSELASRGLPSGEELKVLKKFQGRIPDEVFSKEYEPPTTDGSGNNRKNLRIAYALLKKAGYRVENGKMVNSGGEPVEFEILLQSPAFERIVQPFANELKRIGVEVRLRTVDAAQYTKRVDEFDFDMIVGSFPQSRSPGNEQRDFWGSAAADEQGSRNIIGIKDPVVDELIDLIIKAPDRKSLVARTRALDRVLLWGYYVIPEWHQNTFRVAYWNKFGRPAVQPKYALGFENWWIDR